MPDFDPEAFEGEAFETGGVAVVELVTWTTHQPATAVWSEVIPGPANIFDAVIFDADIFDTRDQPWALNPPPNTAWTTND